MTTEPVRVIATLEPEPGTHRAVLEILTEVAAHTRREPGNEGFEMYRSANGGRTRYHLIERFENAAAIDAHRASAHYRAYRERIGGLLAAPIDVAILEPVDVTGPLRE